MWLTMLTSLYLLCALLLAVYTLGQAVLLIQYWHHRLKKTPLPRVAHHPRVTVQLPLYNEQHVVTRLLNAVTTLAYPRQQLHIQVLDDSTDSTSELVATLVAQFQARGFQIEHIRRVDRSGYKAGALAYGLTQTNSEFVAILDADFVPPRDFVQRTLPYLLKDARLGVVQTRWGHLNADENLLTQAQRLAIDSHFVIEQTARSQSGWFVPFNGTGGVWRADCIRDAGGWRSETLTEDLDLSYRAQLCGWKSLYLPDVVVPGELPPQLAAYRQQQRRWAMGSVQCLRLLGAATSSHAALSPFGRIMALHHLCQYLPQPMMMILLLLTPPLLLTHQIQKLPLAPLGIVGLIPPLMYLVSQGILYPQKKWRHLMVFPALLLLATGLSWSNTQAVWTALRGRNLTFDRTPKFAAEWHASTYALRRLTLPTEVGWALYALFGVGIAWRTAPALIPYLLVYVASFSAVSLWELHDAWQLRQQKPTLTPKSVHGVTGLKPDHKPEPETAIP